MSEDERIRKIYVKDLKVGETVHTVFRATEKEKHTSRAGKTFLSFTLQDRTGEMDGRVFDTVDAAEKAFADGDYLLVKGKVGVFHGKNQLVLESLERLDPTPLDPKEFTPPPREAKEPKEPREPREAREPGAGPRPEVSPEAKDARKQMRSRILRLLDDPQVLDGLVALFKHLDGWAEDRAAGGAPRATRPPRGPRVEHRPEVKPTPAPEGKKPPRDASLPGAFTFKPFSAVAGSEPAGSTETPAAAETASAPEAPAAAGESPKSDA